MTGMTMRDVWPFLRAWTSNPSRVGAIAPSGGALADLMTREIDATSGPVIELGPGTGVFTRALLARGLKEEDLTLIEYGSDFARLLQFRFPDARVIWSDAARMGELKLFEESSVGAAISGLPLLNMSPRQVMAVLAATFGYLRPGGALYQFTYGPRCPVPRRFLDRLGLRSACVGRALLNVPPASVYRITRRKPSKLAL